MVCPATFASSFWKNSPALRLGNTTAISAMSVPNSRNSSLATVCRKGGVVVGGDVDVGGKVEGLMVQCLRGTSFGENLGQLAVMKTILKKSPAYQALRHPDLNGSGRPGGSGCLPAVRQGLNMG
ncbi:MAG: hypothetical protein BRD50_05470 [Bacteroidetes bacterium SW_11_45_7]|nr:MAG: hypothetical protein BRD50_05470 [Bacteroidetes bacterium SW_11_45_7]